MAVGWRERDGACEHRGLTPLAGWLVKSPRVAAGKVWLVLGESSNKSRNLRRLSISLSWVSSMMVMSVLPSCQAAAATRRLR